METADKINESRWRVVDSRLQGTLLSLWLSNESDLNDQALLLLEISFQWDKRQYAGMKEEYVPVFETAYMSKPDAENTSYVGMNERQVNDLIGEWAHLVT